MEGEGKVEEVIKQDELFFKNEEIFFQNKKYCSSKSREVIPGYDLILPKQQNCYHLHVRASTVSSLLFSFFSPSPQTQKVFSFNVKKNPGKT